MERRMKKNRTSATVSPGRGERRQKGVALLPGLSYYLWKATCLYLLQAKQFCLYLHILGPKEPFLYVCVQNGRTSKQLLHWCLSYSYVWFSVSSVRVRSSELSRGPSMQTSVLYISCRCFSAFLILTLL